MRLVPRRAGLAVVITLGVIAAAVALTGTVIAASRNSHPAKFKAPLLVYPVSQSTPGQCSPGTHGVTGPGAAGQTCYQVTQGIAIKRVSDIHVQRGGTSYDVSISLLPSDSKSFAALTRRVASGGSLALVMRGRLVTAPRVQEPITEGKILITGAPRRQDADRLVNQLKGAGVPQLPASTPAPAAPSPAPTCTPTPATPAAGTPTAATPIGTPSGGGPLAGAPSAGAPSAGAPSAGAPPSGAPACTPSPAAGVPGAAPSSLAPPGATQSGPPPASTPP
jgi:hypothetical protein